MRITELLKRESIELDVAADSKEEAIDKLVSLMDAGGRLNDKAGYKEGILAREALGSTAIGEGIAIPHARPECGVRRNCFSLVVLEKPIPFADSEKADIVIMFGARDSNAHIEEGIRSIVALLDNNDTMAKLRTARSREEVVALL